MVLQRVDLQFDNMMKANNCFDKKDIEEKLISYTIENRSMKCKGVITRWRDRIEELVEALDNPEQILIHGKADKKNI